MHCHMNIMKKGVMIVEYVKYVVLDGRLTMFVGFYVWRFDGYNLLILCNSHLYKYFHFINFVTFAYIRRNSLRIMYKHQNMYACYKKQIIVTIYSIVHLLDKNSKILQNALYIHQDYVLMFNSVATVTVIPLQTRPVNRFRPFSDILHGFL